MRQVSFTLLLHRRRHSNPAQYERNRRFGPRVMRSAGKPRVRGYHPSANDWTPLSRKPCWERRHPSLARLCSAVTLAFYATPWLCALMRWAGRGPRNPMLTTWTESGIVSGRVALLPRSVEVRPGFFTFPPPAPSRQRPHTTPDQFFEDCRPHTPRSPPRDHPPTTRTAPPHGRAAAERAGPPLRPHPPLGASPRTRGRIRLRKIPRSFSRITARTRAEHYRRTTP